MGLISYIGGRMVGRAELRRTARRMRDEAIRTKRCPCCGQRLPNERGRR